MKGNQEEPSLFWVATEERQHLQTLHCETGEGALLPSPRVAHLGSAHTVGIDQQMVGHCSLQVLQDCPCRRGVSLVLDDADDRHLGTDEGLDKSEE